MTFVVAGTCWKSCGDLRLTAGSKTQMNVLYDFRHANVAEVLRACFIDSDDHCIFDAVKPSIRADEQAVAVNRKAAIERRAIAKVVVSKLQPINGLLTRPAISGRPWTTKRRMTVLQPSDAAGRCPAARGITATAVLYSRINST